ncbi:TRAP transporter large permease [Parasulfitobacter algicola]|uniref:TRAP transporter large permease n=1 Tax=Parasulfitobacter algicola TaxID=2614809 RepID=A0ABX2IRY4_9RHOB|nr:TRAP transporter large permease [Sulfitobacter algicola]NSX54776.1 TRAP transporter large permease [Sulfitobacter algicola]
MIDVAIIAFVIMLIGIFLRVPIALAMGLTGFFGSWYVMGTPNASLSQLKTQAYTTFASQSLAIVPLFLLMGQLATKTGMSAALFNAASDWLGHRKGGIAMASVGACAGFGAICGSSLATASTMGQVALPEMRRRGYSDSLSTGVLAAGGTLGILIPPSIILVIYAIQAEANIEHMFAAALIPGLVAAAGYLITVAIYVRVKPRSATSADRIPYRDRFRTLAQTWPVIAIFGLTMGGLIGDWNWVKPGSQALFTPNEAAAFGATSTAFYGIVTRRLGWSAFLQAIIETAKATGMIFFILLGAEIFKGFLARTRTPDFLADWVMTQGFTPIMVLTVMLLCYLIFGCVMDSLSMILLTIPIFLPIIEALDFGLVTLEMLQNEAAWEVLRSDMVAALPPDLVQSVQSALRDGAPLTASQMDGLGVNITDSMFESAKRDAALIWFGILALIVVEVGLITPPVGMNLFIINGVARDIPISKTYWGVAPFVASDLVRVVLLVSFPAITLWLVNILF